MSDFDRETELFCTLPPSPPPRHLENRVPAQIAERASIAAASRADNLRTFVSSPLLRSELTMAGIGYELGFEDPSYFSRFIRRELKTSPAEFRSLIRQKIPEIDAIVPGLVFGSLLRLRNLIS